MKFDTQPRHSRRRRSAPGNGLTELVALTYEGACNPSQMAALIEGAVNFFSADYGAILIWPEADPGSVLPIVTGLTTDRVNQLCQLMNKSGSIINRLSGMEPCSTIDETGPAPWITDGGADSIAMLASVVANDDGNRCILFLARETDERPFSAPETETLRSLSNYMRRAIDLNKRYLKIFSDHKSLLAVMDHSSRAIMILGQRRQLTYQNMEAQQLLGKQNGLKIVGDELAIDDERTKNKIDAFLDVLQGSRPDLSAHRLITLIPRISGGSPYKLMMLGLPFEAQQAALNDDEALAVMLIYDPETLVDLNTTLLQSFYSLTPAESTLAQSLFTGKTLPEASEALGISINTTRTHLRSIFKKVGVHSQAALMQELAQSFIPS